MAGLYVHVPFRRAARDYDDAYTVVTDATDFEDYATALRCELQDHAREFAAEEPITTVYAGGGRPSLLPLSTAHALRTAVASVFDASSFEEATAEVNPADATPAYLRGLRRMGFDRLSIGALSLFPADLEDFDAPHSAEDVIRAVRRARNAGFDNLSLDLLFGGPGRHPFSRWRAALHLAVELRIPHLTLIEAPASSSGASHPEARADRLEFAMRLLRSEGYDQYELTHFAQSGYASAHQTHYYAHGNHLGVGPSAESFWWTDRDRSVGRRWRNVNDLDRYEALLRRRRPPVAARQTLDRRALAQEYVMLRLRTNEGLDLDRLREEYDWDLRAHKAAELDRLQEHGLLQEEENTISLTTRGRLLADGVTQRLIPLE